MRLRPGCRACPFTGLILATLLGLSSFACPAAAQGKFAPVIRVNDKAITGYEIEQRILLLRALGASGEVGDEARERLIDERLQVQAAEDLDIEVTEEDLRAAIEEYAQRANTDIDTFVSVLGQNGVAEESVRAFVEAGVLWREVVRTRFAPRAQISEEEVNRALALAGRSGGARVLVSEIVLPARDPDELAEAEARATQIAELSSFDGFAAAARDYSAAGSARQGGRIDWLPLAELPPPLQTQLLTLPPGGVTEPLRVPNAIALFQLRALEELPPQQPVTVAIEYAALLVPEATLTETYEIAQRTDTCDDFYGAGRRGANYRLIRETQAPSEIPRDIALELARLDENETSLALTRDNARLVLMLCGRTTEQAEALDRGAVRGRLANQRIASYAEAYLSELRADAVITGAE